MERHGIPTARFSSCQSLDDVQTEMAELEAPPVIKDDALAGGKGVTVAETMDEALVAAEAIFLARENARVIVEERLVGYEVSAMAFCDGRGFRMMPLSCDYKRLRDGDQGPNTGGMGAYAPASISAALKHSIETEIVEPTIRGMAAEGRPFVGVLYPGLMITADGPKVLEYNCRFGDPEAEALLPLLESDLVGVALACTEGRLDEVDVHWSSQSSCAVVLASPGYPDKPEVAEPRGWADVPEAVVFRGGASGRVLTVSANGVDLAQARQRAYAATAQVHLPGGQYRRDVGAYDRASGVAD
jgi:phosphoribosylamine--glycine ligase